MNRNKKNKGTGAGGKQTNINGIKFENNIYLKEWIQKAGYQLQAINNNLSLRTGLFKVLKNNKPIAYYGRQSQVYNALKSLEPKKFKNKYINKVLSKKIYPDAFILSFNPRRLTIFEKKWQQSEGSVDEKIQTAPFKLAMFEKLLRGTNINCLYQYVLSSWFQQKKYRNVKEYYLKNKKINLFTKGENLEKLNIEDYLK